MRMIGKWGFKIAKKSNIKSVRRSYKSTSYYSTIYDASYMLCIEMESSDKKNITSILSQITDPVHLPFQNEMFIAGDRSGDAVLYEPNKFPFGCIGPCNFIWKKSEEGANSSLWIFVHPSYVKQIHEILTKLGEEKVKLVLREGEKKFLIVFFYFF